MKRKIPATMVSQHPDHAGKPYWLNSEFIGTHNEARECYLSFSELGSSEYKWDWEGKLVDESVVERLFMKHFDYFKENPLGLEKFLTFRLPNPNVQTEYRLGRAFMGLLSASGLAKGVGLHTPPLFEVILPMTETAEEMIDIQEAFSEISSLKHHLNSSKNGSLKYIGLIPLFEKVETICNSDKIIETYVRLHKKAFKKKPDYMRPYIARSDPALNSGLVPTVLSVKMALAKYKRLEMRLGIKLFPIIGSASLPFRGGLTPESVDDFIEEYSGVKTALLQSAFRYDYEKAKVIEAIKRLEFELPRKEPRKISKVNETKLMEIVEVFGDYQKTVEQIAPIVNKIASRLPKRRERVQHIGLFGYSRGLGKVRLPRAIGFTAALYSLGVPPELIGTGRGLKRADKLGLTNVLEKYYVNLMKNMVNSGYYLNKTNLGKLAKSDSAWKGVLKDVGYIEEYIRCDLGPKTPEHAEHEKLTTRLYKKLAKGMDFTDELTRCAVLRRSMG
jgi:phosphoenolpyruvate carboxylase